VIRKPKKPRRFHKKRTVAKKRLRVAAAPAGPADIVDIPPKNTFNKNLSSATEATMLQLFGVPGERTDDCSPATGAFKKRILSRVDVGPFKVSGLDIAVKSLKAAFDEAEEQIPNVVAVVKNDGMLCVRHKRNNPNSFSNHSWGTAIDLFFGTQVVPQGTPKTHRGVLQLAPFFNKHGWYWGAGFSGKSVDSMHFELAEETISNPPATS
jgi:D-alanyl-D-alanine carboxypeptidase